MTPPLPPRGGWGGVPPPGGGSRGGSPKVRVNFDPKSDKLGSDNCRISHRCVNIGPRDAQWTAHTQTLRGPLVVEVFYTNLFRTKTFLGRNFSGGELFLCRNFSGAELFLCRNFSVRKSFLDLPTFFSRIRNRTFVCAPNYTKLVAQSAFLTSECFFCLSYSFTAATKIHIS